MNHPLVSIVIPCYQYGCYLADCIRAALNQTNYPEVEVIVINDASPDNTEEVLQSFNDPRVHVIRHEKNQGNAISISEGLLQARGKYICRIDADDRHLPDFLIQTVPIMERDPEVGAVFGGVNLINGEGEQTSAGQTAERDRRENIFIEILRKNIITAPTLLARKELWLAALPIPEGLTHTDWYLNLQLARRAVFVERAKVLADYRVHQSNLHSILTVTKKEEPTTFRILDQIFSEQESDPQLQRQKLRSRREIYGAQYADLSIKYFGARHFEDSKRCFLKGLALSPKLFMTSVHLRVLAALIMGVKRYESLKAVIKSRP